MSTLESTCHSVLPLVRPITLLNYQLFKKCLRFEFAWSTQQRQQHSLASRSLHNLNKMEIHTNANSLNTVQFVSADNVFNILSTPLNICRSCMNKTNSREHLHTLFSSFSEIVSIVVCDGTIHMELAKFLMWYNREANCYSLQIISALVVHITTIWNIHTVRNVQCAHYTYV